MAINASIKRLRCHGDWQINFSPYKENNIDDDGNNPINNSGVDMILVDDGSVVEVLIYDIFKKMNLDESLLRPAGLIYDFANQPIKAKGLINLSITLGTRENMITKEVEFFIIDQPSVYNAIIDRPLMKKISMVIALYYLTIKFLTSTKVGYVKANLTIAR